MYPWLQCGVRNLVLETHDSSRQSVQRIYHE